MKKNRTLTLLLAWVASFVCCLSYAQHFTASPAPSGGSFATGTKWYTIKITTENNGTVYTVYLDANAKNSAGHLGVTQSSKPTGDSGLWCVVADGSNYKFYNKALGTGYVLGLYAPVTYTKGDEWKILWSGTGRYKLGTWSIPEDAYAKMYSTSSIGADVWTSFALGSPSTNTDGDYFHAVTGKSETYYTSVASSSSATTTPDNIYLNKRVDLSPTRLGAWNNSGALGDKGSRLIFEEYVPTVEVTFNYNSGTGYTASRTASVLSGKTLTNEDVPAVDYYTNFNITTSNKTVSSTNKTFTVSCTPNFPFQEGKVYKMYGYNNSDNCFTYNDDTNKRATYEGNKTEVNGKSYWTFEHISGTENKFYVYNLGAKMYLALTNDRAYASFVTESGTISNYSRVIRITPNGNGFNLQHETGNACCGTHMGGVVNTETNSMGTWANSASPSNDASRVFIYEINNELTALANNPVTTGEYVGETTLPRLTTTAAAAGSNPTKENVLACIDAMDNPQLSEYLTAGKCYRLFAETTEGNQALTLNGATETYVSADNFTLAPGTVCAVAESGIAQADYISSIYRLADGASGLTISNVNAGAAWAAPSGTDALQGTTGTAAEYQFGVVSGKGNNSYWNIKTATGALSLDGTDLKDTTGSPAVVRLKEVTSIPVTIKPTLWTSLCFPVDVVVPANLKAYKAGSTQGTTINLDELTAGTRIPAGTGFLALADADAYTDGAYTFDIATGTEPAADLSGNLFTSTNVKRSGMADVEYFALATKNKVTGFYKVGTGTVPANKAYLLGEKLNQGAGANMLQFAFGEGTETGISNVNAENSGKAETYYDLNGRLVAYPTSGVYVTGSGRKVFVK
ncbi:MAG: hypothetical protein PUF44_08350 [Bacteroidales bacterium]|nr:hypothetical protein [Bacteroidales bacterium]